MKLNRGQVWTLILLISCILLHIYSLNGNRVEYGYSTHFSPYFSASLRWLFGWLPFSVGDVFYGMVVAWLLWKLIGLIRKIFRRQPVRLFAVKDRFWRYAIAAMLVYLLFNIFWGLNYNRSGIASQLKLDVRKFPKDDLVMLNKNLLQKVNASKAVLVTNGAAYPKNRELFQRVQKAYGEAAVKFSFLDYRPKSIKPSMWGWLGNYAGFTGYYNPFTGEAQVNTTVPRFLQPFITCHEVAHQLGYAKEMEANFVGYLAAVTSKDTLLHYSCYLDMFLYANNNLRMYDSTMAKDFRKQLSSQVKSDLEEWIRFSRSHKNFVEPAIRWMYGKYLQGNQQPQGVLAYDEVTVLLIAYYQKFGEL